MFSVCVSLQSSSASFLLSLAVVESSGVEGALSLFSGKSSTNRHCLLLLPPSLHVAAAADSTPCFDDDQTLHCNAVKAAAAMW